MQAELVDRVESVLAGVGLLLVFVLALFDLNYPRLRATLDEEAPAADRPIERRRYRAELRRTLVTGALPPAIVNAVVAYALAPLAQDVVADGGLRVWDFHEVLMTFVLLYALIVAFAIWSLGLLARVALKLRATAP
jgi:hypothetical protein